MSRAATDDRIGRTSVLRSAIPPHLRNAEQVFVSVTSGPAGNRAAAARARRRRGSRYRRRPGPIRRGPPPRPSWTSTRRGPRRRRPGPGAPRGPS